MAGDALGDALDLEALLTRLIRAESPDPPGDERRVAAVVAEELERRGFTPEVEEFQPNRFNVTARLRGHGARSALVFSAHMDTLPAGRPPGRTRPSPASATASTSTGVAPAT